MKKNFNTIEIEKIIFFVAVSISLSLSLYLPYSSPSFGANVISISTDFPFGDDDVGELRESMQQRMESTSNSINSNTQIQSSRQSTGTLNADGNYGPYSGKIATVQFDTANAEVLRTFYGDWSLDTQNDRINFQASFTMNDLVKDTTPFRFSIDNVRINSIQQSNDDLKFGGISDISRQSTIDGKTSLLNDIPTTITIIENKALIVTFDNSAFPITGTVENS